MENAGNQMGYIISIDVLNVRWKQKETRNYKENKDMKKNKKFWDTLIAVGILLVYLSIFSCGSSHTIPKKDCCSSSGVKDTSVTDTKVNFDLVKKDGVIIILPTTTKDTIK